MYAKLNNGVVETYPYTIGDLRKDNPQCSFPKNLTKEILDQFNVVAVQKVTPPVVANPAQVAVQSTPQMVDGTWYQTYQVVDLSAEEFAKKQQDEATFIRGARNQKLSDCDWTQGKDIGDAVSSAWATYRQALRDVPQQNGFPFSVTWPNKPE